LKDPISLKESSRSREGKLKMEVGTLGCHAASGSALQESFLEEKGLNHVFERRHVFI
jgi:hypothetical protein